MIIHVTEGEIIRPDFTETLKKRRQRRREQMPMQVKTGFCPHEYVFLDQQRGKVICRHKDCGAELDPFEKLLKIARKWEHVTYLKQEIEELSARVEVLKREEKKIKARIRSKGGKVPSPWEMPSAIALDEEERAERAKSGTP